MSSDTAKAVAEFMSARDRFAAHLGFELLELKPGQCRVGLDLAPYMVNGLGIPHGAVIFALADFAFAAACNSYGQTAVALSMDIHFLSSPRPETRLTALASEVRRGRRTGLYRMVVTGENDVLIAELHGMAYIKDERFLEEQQR